MVVGCVSKFEHARCIANSAMCVSEKLYALINFAKEILVVSLLPIVKFANDFSSFLLLPIISLNVCLIGGAING